MIKKTLYHTLRCHARLSIYRHFFWERNAAKTPRPNFQNVIYKLLSSMLLFLNLQKSSWYFCCYFFWFEYGLYVQVRQDSFLSVYSCIVERDENQWKSPNDLCCRRHTNHKKWLQMTIAHNLHTTPMQTQCAPCAGAAWVVALWRHPLARIANFRPSPSTATTATAPT